MDKKYQDIHYQDSQTNYEYVLRCVHIITIDMSGDFIEIYFKFPNESPEAKLDGGVKTKIMFLPKIRGAKLIID